MEPAVKYQALPQMTPGEFIVWETAQEYKHEYVSGKIVAMAGASIRHNKIQLRPVVVGSPILNRSFYFFSTHFRIGSFLS